MSKRYAAIWFPSLLTDWALLKQVGLRDKPFVFAKSGQGRLHITAANAHARAAGISLGMVLADAKASLPSLEVLPDKPNRANNLLRHIGLWCIRYTPIVALDLPDGLLLDITGCAHLWGGEAEYKADITRKLHARGYDNRIAIADTLGAAWGLARFAAERSPSQLGVDNLILQPKLQRDALALLPIEALRLEADVVAKLHKLGLYGVAHIINMPSPALRKRFGAGLVLRLQQALGLVDEYLKPLQPPSPYVERLPCLEPIRTAKGIELAIQQLLEPLCLRLYKEGNGLRSVSLKCFRVDGKEQEVAVQTSRATAHSEHLLGMFALKIASIEPALGIELFVMEGLKVERLDQKQEEIWVDDTQAKDDDVAELIDRIKGRDAGAMVYRYFPSAHHWPERSIYKVDSFANAKAAKWTINRPRPIRLLNPPERIEVAAPIPDYPPMLFRYRDAVYPIKKADGPERIEREWWLEKGEHRDYYIVEDEKGRRYWLFRLGHYAGDQSQEWFLHGFFA